MKHPGGGTELPERTVLGSMLRLNAVIGDVLQLVRAEDFFFDAHQRVFRAAADLYASGKPADLVTVAEWLRQRGWTKDAPYTLLAELWDAAPTAANAEYYARIVRDMSLCRQLAHAGAEIVRDATDRAGPADDLLEQAEQRIFRIAHLGVSGQAVPLAEAVDDACQRMDSRSFGGRPTGLLTGWIDLDSLTGGLQDGEFVVIAARPSCGKTALGLGLALNVIRRGEPVFFASLEQSRVELADRVICNRAHIDSLKWRKGWISQEERLRADQAVKELRGLTMLIDDTAVQSALRIGANARRMKLRHSIRLVVVDYLQLVEPADRRAPRQEQVAAVSRQLKQLARELQVPVVAMAQLNRGVEDRQGQQPRLSDLRESGAIEADADVVWLLHRPPDTTGVVEVNVAKQRNGPTGEVSLAFVRDQMRFENYALSDPFGGNP